MVVNRWSCARVCALVFLAAFAVRVGLMFATQSYLYPDSGEVLAIAKSLATHGAFADAYCNGCGPTAHSAPLYPLLLSLIFRLFGMGVAGNLAQEVFSSLLASLQYALVPYVAEICGMRRFTGLLGGLLGALLPINRWVQTKGNFEYALAGLLCVIVTMAVIRTWQKQDFSWRRGVLLGLLWGVTLLTAPQFALLMIVLLAYPYLTMPTARSRYWIFILAHLVVVTLCLAPWAIRNLNVLGSPIWGRSNVGLELNLSNNQEASAVWQENWDNGLFERLHPYISHAQRERLREVGEVAYNREQLSTALHWMASHPARFVRLTAQRVFYFWISPLKRIGQTIALAVITLLGFWGFFRYVRSGSFGWQYFSLLWFFFPLSTYLFQQSGRLRYPIEWSSFLFAGYWFVSVAKSGPAHAGRYVYFPTSTNGAQ